MDSRKSNNHDEFENVRTFYNNMMTYVWHNHDSIWEEIKHFSWLLSVILAAPFVLLLQQNNGEKLFKKYGWIFAIFGLIISLIARKIIQKESEHMDNFSYYALRAERALGLHQPSKLVNESSVTDTAIVAPLRQRYLLKLEERMADSTEDSLKWKSNIRKLFVNLFNLYAVLATILLGYILFINF